MRSVNLGIHTREAYLVNDLDLLDERPHGFVNETYSNPN